MEVIEITDAHGATVTGPWLERAEAVHRQLRTALRQHTDVDLLVMDVSLPGKNGIDILKVLREEMPRLKVLIVSMYPEDQYAVRAFRVGAAGYLNKASAPEKLVEAISQVIAGRKYVTPEIAQALIENLNAVVGPITDIG